MSSVPYPDPLEKQCGDCKETKPIESFHKDPRNKKTGRASYCKACHRRRGRTFHLGKVYGITQADYDTMYSNQLGMCAICRAPARADRDPDKPERRRGPRVFNGDLVVDHDHKTRQVRALLCHTCNIGLGAFRDNPELLRAAADYAEHHARKRKKAA